MNPSKPLEVVDRPWAILPEALEAIRASASSARELPPVAAAQMNRGGYGANGITAAVIPVRGIIWKRAGLMSQIFGGTTVENLTSQFRSAVSDPSVKAIVFDVDSPGGTVEGVPELAEEIYKSRGRKKSVAVANGMAASAAYWIASAAGSLVVAPSGSVGSIGVFMEHVEFSKALDQAGIKPTLISAGKYKVDGNDYEPLSYSARQDMQEKVDAFYGMFVRSVASGRGVSQADVRGGFGEGRMVLAQKAVAARMADRVGTLDQTIAGLGSGRDEMGPGSSAGHHQIALRRLELDAGLTPSPFQKDHLEDLERRRRELDLL